MSSRGFEDPGPIELSISPDTTSVSVARAFAASVGRLFGLSDERLGDVKIAVSEAVTNAARALDRSGMSDPIVLQMRRRDGGLLVEIADRAGELDAPVSDASYTPPFGLAEGSLGLILIRSLFDNTDISRNSIGGTTVRFLVAPEVGAGV